MVLRLLENAVKAALHEAALGWAVGIGAPQEEIARRPSDPSRPAPRGAASHPDTRGGP